MTKKICIFPGQGSQKIGMGKEFHDNFSCAKQVFEEVNDSLGQNLTKIIFEGNDEELTLTENAQPAIMATSIAMLRVLESEAGFEISKYADFVAGHSLGEYTALCAAGFISLSDTAKLLKIRGKAMQKAVPIGVGGMAVILGLDIADVEDIAKLSSSNDDICEVANDNSAGQIVVSGTLSALDKACKLAKEKGAKRAMLLPVSAPFHCSLIKPAADEMESALGDVEFVEAKTPLIANVTAKQVTDIGEIKELLVSQVTSRVRWVESIQYAVDAGVRESLEIGEGKVLTGLIKRISKEINTLNFGNVEDIKQAEFAA